LAKDSVWVESFNKKILNEINIRNLMDISEKLESKIRLLEFNQFKSNQVIEDFNTMTSLYEIQINALKKEIEKKNSDMSYIKKKYISYEKELVTVEKKYQYSKTINWMLAGISTILGLILIVR